MSGALTFLVAAFVIVDVALVMAWAGAIRSRRVGWRPGPGDVAIGIGTCFLDTLGIGNYAQITALYKFRGHPQDELIPGTLNVGLGLPILFSATLFTTSVNVDSGLLLSMVLSAGAGAWLGAGIVSRMQRRMIQLCMGTALIVAACFFTLTNVGVLPPPGTATALGGWRFVVAVSANFVLGALMCAGIGNYAPSMALLAILGMHPLVAYPIMIGSDGVLIPVAGLRFIRSGRFNSPAAMGLTLGGILGTLLAFPLVKTLAGHLTLMRWVVIAVILYAAVAMLRSAWASGAGAPATVAVD